MFVFDLYDFEGLISTQCDEEEVQDELPRETVEADVLLKRTQGHFFDEIHLDDALLMFFHV